MDIRRDGSLDLEPETLRQLDVVVASVHSYLNLPRGEMTRRVVRAVESGLIHILGHPTGDLPADFPVPVAIVQHRSANPPNRSAPRSAGWWRRGRTERVS